MTIIKTILRTKLGNALWVLPFIMLGNILFAVVLADFNHKYDPDRLKAGIIKGLTVYVGIALYSFVSQFTTDIQIELAGNAYNLVNAMYFIVWGAVAKYAVDGITKLAKIMKVETGDVE